MLTIPFITGGCSSELKTIEANLAFKAEATTGEGSIWHPDRNTLFWVDIEGKTLYEFIRISKTVKHGSSTVWCLRLCLKQIVR